MLENQVFQLTILHVNKLIAMTKTIKLVNTYAIQHLFPSNSEKRRLLEGKKRNEGHSR